MRAAELHRHRDEASDSLRGVQRLPPYAASGAFVASSKTERLLADAAGLRREPDLLKCGGESNRRRRSATPGLRVLAPDRACRRGVEFPGQFQDFRKKLLCPRSADQRSRGLKQNL